MKVSVGQHSDKGRQPVNQDFFGARIPQGPLLASKGIAVALADGIGSSDVSQVAAEFAVMGFLDDYYCTSEAWSVKRSAERVLAATNAWLHSRTRHSPYRFDADRGYVCTLSALVLKSTTAHLFHVGDSRIYRLQGAALERLTDDHRVQVSADQSTLSRAVGFNPQLEIDYQALPLAEGDMFVLATDGVHEHVDEAFIARAVREGRHDLDATARRIVDEALQRGSPDNLTLQIVAVDALPAPEARELQQALGHLALPPPLAPGMEIDGWRIVRELHTSHRSHLHLAVDTATGEQAVLKTPSTDLREDAAALDRFLVEEWVARRLRSPHVLKPAAPARARQHLYVASEYLDGQTLAQWLRDHPRPDLETVRCIVEQIAQGLQAFHRMEMLHQDLRLENLMIDRTGTVKIIDFGSVQVAGLSERDTLDAVPAPLLGTLHTAAPEYFLGEAGSWRSDLFSLAVVTYQLLASGALPYGTQVAQARTPAAQRRLRYRPLAHEDRELPAWIDEVLRRALQPDPLKRHEALSAFVHDLRHPSAAYLRRARPAVAQRHPVAFWQGVAAVLALLLLALAMVHFGGFRTAGRAQGRTAATAPVSTSSRIAAPSEPGRLAKPS